MEFLLLLILALPIIIFMLILNLQTQNPKHAPGPRGLPLIGNLYRFEPTHTYLHRISTKYGPVMSLKLGSRRVVVISSAEAVREIIQSNDVAFSSRPALVGLRRLSYNGLGVAFSPYSDAWKALRKLSSLHFFNSKQLQNSRPIMRDEVSLMMKRIGMDAASSKETDLQEITMSYTTNILCRVAFGKSYGWEGYERNPFCSLLSQTETVLSSFFVEDYFPLFRWIDHLSGMVTMLHKTCHDMDSFFEELIQEHTSPNRPKSMEGDIIDIMLGMKDDGSSSFHLTLDNIKAILMDLIMGGSDAPAAAIEWALASLMKKPLEMKKVQAEIRQVAGKKDMVDEVDIEKFPYFKAVVNETMRLFPPGPLLIPRETIQKCSVKGYEIEAGTTVYISAWSIGRDPTTWRDADEFLPERFLDSEIDVRSRNPEVIPFGIGRRGCPGMGMGMAEVELALANLLYKFEWELPSGMKQEDIDFDSRHGLAMHKKNVLRLVPKLALF